MTLITGQVSDVGMNDASGVFYARATEFRGDGTTVVSPSPATFTITGGNVSADVAPGPTIVTLHVGPVRKDWFVNVPESPIGLGDLIATYMEYEPAVVSAAIKARDAAIEAESEAKQAAIEAEARRKAAELAAAGAETAKRDTMQAADAAVTAKNEAGSSAGAAVTAKESAESARATSVTKAGEASSSADAAVTAKNEAEAARGVAVTKAGEASSSAAAAATAKSDAEVAAAQAGQDRAHVDSIRDTLDEAAQSNVAPYLTQTALNATYAVQVTTVAAMLATSLPVGSLVQTHGYYAAGDGGACRYVVIAAKSKSYDLNGSGRAFRPSVNGTLHPKMFGTVNDGTALDNLPLQACYDYAADQGLGYIDGQGLTYTIGTINPIDTPRRGWAHTGALMKSGRTMANATFRTATGSTNGTCAAAVDMINDGSPTYFRNCVFDGNRPGVTAEHEREDGGAHLVLLNNSAFGGVGGSGKDFTPTGDVYFEGCHFKRAYSYGVMPMYLDAMVKFTDCTWDVTGIGVLLHATRVVIDGAKIHSGPPRAGKVPNPISAEAEFGHNYTGSKKLSVELRRISYSTTVTKNALVKLHYAPMQHLTWAAISLDSCISANSVPLLEAYSGLSSVNPSPSTLVVDELRISDSRSAGGDLIRLECLRESSKFITVHRLAVDRLSGDNSLVLLGADAGTIELTSPTLGASTTVSTGSTVVNVGRLRVTNARGTLGVNGILRGFANVTVDQVEIVGGEFTQGGTATLECVMGDVLLQSLIIHSPPSGFRRLVFPRGVAPRRVRLLDNLLTSTTPTGPVVFGTFSDGVIQLRNTRHISAVSSPTVEVTGLPPGRIVTEGVSPLVP